MENNENQIFRVKDCTLIVRMGGVEPAINLREFRERLKTCPPECIYHHFSETLIRPTFDYPEFRNDFAIWSYKYLGDKVLAERLGVINPHSFNDLEELRVHLIDIIDERLDEVHFIPWVKKDNEFRLLRAATIVFDTGQDLSNPIDLIKILPNLSTSSIYYHFIEARRRTKESIDDFTAWMKTLDNPPGKLIELLADIDFYFLNLSEIKETLVDETVNLEEKDLYYA